MECLDKCYGLMLVDFVVAKNRKDFSGAHIVYRDCAGCTGCYVPRKEVSNTYAIQPARNGKISILHTLHKGHFPLRCRQRAIPLEGRAKELVNFIMRFRKEKYRVLERNYQPAVPIPKGLVDYLRSL